MIYPKFLKENGCIGVPAPSASASNEQYSNVMKKSTKYLEGLGFKLEISKNLYGKGIRGRSAKAEDRGKK